MNRNEREHLWCVFKAAVAFVAVCALFLALSSCQSTPKHEIPAEHRSAFDEAAARSRALLVAVGAPVSDDLGAIRVSYAEGNYDTQIPCTGIKGRGLYRGVADFIVGKNVVLPLDQGEPQIDYWSAIIMHFWLRGNEEADYYWINQAIGACMDSSTPRR